MNGLLHTSDKVESGISNPCLLSSDHSHSLRHAHGNIHGPQQQPWGPTSNRGNTKNNHPHGKSNQHPLTYAVPNIKSVGVQVYTIGIANPDVSELQFISSDPDEEHVFLFKSYNDASGFVDFLSVQTCHSEYTVRLLELLVL